MLQVGEPSPDRDEQFGIINDLAKQYLETGDPVISVDTKKKENIGNFKNNGAEYRKSKDPRKVLDHDFPFAELGKVSPYGVYVRIRRFLKISLPKTPSHTISGNILQLPLIIL